MIPFPSRLNGYYCEEKKGSYGPKFSETYSEASQSIPQKEKNQGVSLYLALLIMGTETEEINSGGARKGPYGVNGVKG
nr:hypothetical protein [Tanacetum cinerariifolium]